MTYTKLTLSNLRTEYLDNPVGIDTRQPRLSWIMESPLRAQRQKAYRILVSSDPKQLEKDVGDIWDSGETESDQSIHILYEGKPLESDKFYYWKVRVWDQDGAASSWSEQAMWAMGLLNGSDWYGNWIGAKEEKSEMITLDDAKWIWLQNEDATLRQSKGKRYFRKTVMIHPEDTVRSARMIITAHQLHQVYVNGKHFCSPSFFLSPLLFDLTDVLKPGENVLAIDAVNIGELVNNKWDFKGIIVKIEVDFEHGKSLTITTGEDWKAADHFIEGWNEIAFDESGWDNARQVAKFGNGPADSTFALPRLAFNSRHLPSPYLRKTFEMHKPIRKAVLYASALGLYELRLNGKRVAENYFAPGWTDYNKRVQYQAYDVTSAITQGGNALGAILGYGWYAGHVAMFGPGRYGDQPYLLLQLNVQYNDGTVEHIVSDSTWKTTFGPIRYSDIFMGEIYDARYEIPGWDTHGFDDATWNFSGELDRYDGLVVAQSDYPVRITEQLKPVAITEPISGTYVIDMGQNMVGWVRFKVKGNAGTRVTLRHAEMLNPDGTIYTANLRNARQTDEYILQGIEIEEFEPHFTFHGFRYVEVTGFPNKPSLDDIVGCVMHTAMPISGKFETSNVLINQLQSNIVWGMRSNSLSIPTDCPQRDERMGWSADVSDFVRTGCFILNGATFYDKWMVDAEDAQFISGAFTDVAPHAGLGAGAAGWGDAGVIVPWTIYKTYGDTRIIEKFYAAMARWIHYCQEDSHDLIRTDEEGYGDWLSIEADTPKEVIATAFFGYSVKLMAEMAMAVGKEADAKSYWKLFQDIQTAFNEKFVDSECRITGDTQAGYVLALHMDLLSEDKRTAAIHYLVEDIKARDWHLSTGFLATGFLMQVLTDNGYPDVAYRLLNQDTFPSWLYPIRNGATTIWERWDGWTTEKGFQDPEMNSFNHYSLGSVGDWLYRYVAGIDLNPLMSPGYKHIVIHPRFGGGLTYCKGEYDSMYGKIASHWELDEGEDTVLKLKVTIPHNTTAIVYVKTNSLSSVTEGGRTIQEAENIRFLSMDDGNAIFFVESGLYTFESKW